MRPCVGLRINVGLRDESLMRCFWKSAQAGIISEPNVGVSKAETMKLEVNPSVSQSFNPPFQSREARSGHHSRLRSADDGRYIATKPLTNSIPSFAPHRQARVTFQESVNN